MKNSTTYLINDQQKDRLEYLYNALFNNIISINTAIKNSMVSEETGEQMKVGAVEFYDGIETYIDKKELYSISDSIPKISYIKQIIWEWRNGLD